MARSAILLFEAEHLESIRSAEAFLVPLDASLEYRLTEQGVSFISGQSLRNRAGSDAYQRAEDITNMLCDSPELSFLTYRNISLIEPLRTSIQVYLEQLFYYIDICSCLFEDYPDIDRLLVPERPRPLSPVVAPMAVPESQVVLEAARIVAMGTTRSVEVIPGRTIAHRAATYIDEVSFQVRRTLFGGALAILDGVQRLRPRKQLRILASDYWVHLAPVMEKLPEAELILLDRTEALGIGLRKIWKHKMRFLHLKHFLTATGREAARTHLRTCRDVWKQIQSTVWSRSDCTYHTFPLQETGREVFSHLMKRAIPNLIEEIEATYAMYEKIAPNSVLLRASVSRQTHFAVLPLVARQSHIPSLELQHGIAYLGPGSAERRRAAEYIATYGPLVSREFRETGRDEQSLIAVGSPRFDSYLTRETPSRDASAMFSILYITPPTTPGIRYDTYDVADILRELGQALAPLPQSHMIITLRGVESEEFMHTAIAHGLPAVSHQTVSGAPIPQLISEADVVVSSYSTVVYEALLLGRAVIIPAHTPIERLMVDFHFTPFAEAGALMVTHSYQELEWALEALSHSENRTMISSRAQEFMKTQFSFDGHAAERVATRIRSWTYTSSREA